MSRYGKLSAGLIGAWFVISLGASALHLYDSGPNRPPLVMGLAALAPVASFLIWFWWSPKFREFTLSLNPRVLTLVQTWRVVGIVFLVLATYGILPKPFALSAGWGDITIGVTALFAALALTKPEQRLGFLAWQALGITDLVTAVALAALSGVIDPHGISTAPMTVLPLSLIPTFAVPLLLILHLVCIAQALRWPVGAGSLTQLHSPAA